jgi:SAM-dependent methyltransferase
MEKNKLTVDTYNTTVAEYIEKTPMVVSGDFKIWMDSFLVKIPMGGTILEIGSGPGRDVNYFEQAGYTVIATDASGGFVDYLCNEKGIPAKVLNPIVDILPDNMDGVFANAVVHHFEPNDLVLVFQKVYNSLNSKGVFGFSTKNGKGEEISEEKVGTRYFKYWISEEIEAMLRAIGFSSIEITTTPDEKWLHVIAVK